VAPFDVHVVVATKDDTTVVAAGEDTAAALERSGLRVLLDDRTGVSPGVKFKDAELLGAPTIVVAGRGVANGTLEVRDRWSGTTADVPLGEVVAHANSLAAGA
jgi:prolyl-tRNA synthetase